MWIWKIPCWKIYQKKKKKHTSQYVDDFPKVKYICLGTNNKATSLTESENLNTQSDLENQKIWLYGRRWDKNFYLTFKRFHLANWNQITATALWRKESWKMEFKSMELGFYVHLIPLVLPEVFSHNPSEINPCSRRGKILMNVRNLCQFHICGLPKLSFTNQNQFLYFPLQTIFQNLMEKCFEDIHLQPNHYYSLHIT